MRYIRLSVRYLMAAVVAVGVTLAFPHVPFLCAVGGGWVVFAAVDWALS